MIDFFVIVPLLFSIFIALMVGVSWISFMRNLVDRNARNRRPGSYPERSGSRMERNHSGSRTQRRSQRQNVSSSASSARATDRRLVEEVLRRSPQDVARLLREYLPERYHGEITRILTESDWRRGLQAFMRRSDIWPVLRKALLTNPKALGSGNKPAWEMSTSQGGEGTMEELAKQLELEYNELAVEYDRVLESEFEQIAPVQVQAATAIKSIEEKRQTAPDSSRLPLNNREWLKQAILGSEILNRPEY